MRNLVLILIFGANLLSLASAYDIPPPGPAPKEKVLNEKDALEKNLQAEAALLKAKLKSFQIRIDKDATEAKLVIPVSILRSIQDNAKSSSDFTPRFFLDDQPILSRVGTVVGGLLLTLAFFAGGLWLIRNRKMTVANIGGIVLIVSLSGIGTSSLLYANMGPPPQARSLTGKIFSEAVHAFKHASGEVRVETTPSGEHIILIVPDSK
jgi:hypothetical protein